MEVQGTAPARRLSARALDIAAHGALLSPHLRLLFASPTVANAASATPSHQPAPAAQRKPAAMQLAALSVPAAAPTRDDAPRRALLCNTLTLLLNCTHDCAAACRTLARPATLARITNLLSNVLASFVGALEGDHAGDGDSAAEGSAVDEAHATYICGLVCLLVNVVERNARAAEALAFMVPCAAPDGCTAAAPGAHEQGTAAIAADRSTAKCLHSEQGLREGVEAMSLDAGSPMLAAAGEPAWLQCSDDSDMDDDRAVQHTEAIPGRAAAVLPENAPSQIAPRSGDGEAPQSAQQQVSALFAEVSQFTATPSAAAPVTHAKTPPPASQEAAQAQSAAPAHSPEARSQRHSQPARAAQAQIAIGASPGCKPAGRRRSKAGGLLPSPAAQDQFGDFDSPHLSPGVAGGSTPMQQSAASPEVPSGSFRASQPASADAAAASAEGVQQPARAHYLLQAHIQGVPTHEAPPASASRTMLHILTDALDCMRAHAPPPQRAGSDAAAATALARAALLERVHEVTCILVGCLLMHSHRAEAALRSKLTVLHLKGCVREAVRRQVAEGGLSDVQRALLGWASLQSSGSGGSSRRGSARSASLSRSPAKQTRVSCGAAQVQSLTLCNSAAQLGGCACALIDQAPDFSVAVTLATCMEHVIGMVQVASSIVKPRSSMLRVLQACDIPMAPGSQDTALTGGTQRSKRRSPMMRTWQSARNGRALPRCSPDEPLWLADQEL
jgi:hypothetical protein